jgi:hypothetical protein
MEPASFARFMTTLRMNEFTFSTDQRLVKCLDADPAFGLHSEWVVAMSIPAPVRPSG